MSDPCHAPVIPPARIASCLAGATETLFALGLGDRVVAVSHECDDPPSVRDLPRITHSRIDADASSAAIDDQVRQLWSAGEPLYTIDTDTLITLRPDLIVTQAHCDVCAVRYDDVVSAVRTSRELSNTRVIAMNPRCLDDLFNDTRRIAIAAGLPDGGEAYLAGAHQRIERASTLGGTGARPRVACIEWTEPLMVAANWMPELIQHAGGTPCITRAGEYSRETDWNTLLNEDPDVIIVAPCGFPLDRSSDEAAALSRRAGWERLRAVRQRRVFAADGNRFFNRSGPRLVDTIELIAVLIHDNTTSEFLRNYEGAWRRIPA